MPTDTQTDKQNMVYTHNEILFSLRKKKILTHAIVQMNFEDIMFSEIISQSQKDKYTMIPLMWRTQSSQLTETESRMLVARG